MATLLTANTTQRENAATNKTYTGKTPDHWHRLATELENPPMSRYRRFRQDVLPAPPQPKPASHQCPSEQCLMTLARAAEFPISSYGMIALAKRRACSPSAIVFLRIFGLNDIFEKGIDFLDRCKEVKLFLREEHCTARRQYADHPAAV